MPPPREMTSSSLYWSICTINTKKKFKNNYDLSSTAFIIALQTILTLRHNNLSSYDSSVSSLLDSGATAAVILWSVFFFLLGAGVGFLLVTVWSKLSLRLSVPIGSRRFLCKVILRFSPFFIEQYILVCLDSVDLKQHMVLPPTDLPTYAFLQKLLFWP